MENMSSILLCQKTSEGSRPVSRADEYTERALSYSLKLYSDRAQGTLRVRVHTPDAYLHASSAIALITEHRPFESRQYALRLGGEAGTELRLPEGDYSVVVRVSGFEPFRSFVTVTPNSLVTIDAKLRKLQEKISTIEEVLAKNMIQRDSRSLRNLTVDAGTTVTLDQTSKEFSGDVEYVPLRTIKDFKRVLGCPDSAFVSEQPRFGHYSPARAPADFSVSGGLDFAQRAALREFIYGNSKSVGTWESSLNKWIISEESSAVLWTFLDINVGKNALLEVTANGLICNKLSVHYTGRVRFKGPGPIKLEMNHYELYGLLDAPLNPAAVVTLI